MNDIKKQKRLSAKQIQAIVNLQEKSSTTVTAFCKAHKIKKATFYNWRNRYVLKSETQQSFVPVHFSNPVGQSALFAEIELATNVTIKLFHKVDASYFKALL